LDQRNPYAPPSTETTFLQSEPQPGSGRGLRIAGGVVLLLFGLWSVLGGSCSVIAGTTFASFSEEMAREQPNEADPELRAAMDQVRSTLRGLLICGVVVLAGGLLCTVAGVLLLLQRGRLFCLIATGTAVAGELLFFALVTFNLVGLVKIAAFGFGGFCATLIHRPRKATDAATAP
jgi:hypothetical protein